MTSGIGLTISSKVVVAAQPVSLSSNLTCIVWLFSVFVYNPTIGFSLFSASSIVS